MSSSSSEEEMKPKKEEKKKEKSKKDKSKKESKKESKKVSNQLSYVSSSYTENSMIELGSMRYVTVRSFRGKALIDIREFYTDKASGEMRPGKKGISLSKEQYQNFKAVMSEIDAKL
ncbi:unnamed protein product [Haemonchus placei]|uniref:PC4 domain-containing protein n=1 Tax=Haemonchus placei TaxID=6290 RepID=A0A158QQJ3_HAEPC|nr:unnamed protein product [Haemonchus placei]